MMGFPSYKLFSKFMSCLSPPLFFSHATLKIRSRVITIISPIIAKMKVWKLVFAELSSSLRRHTLLYLPTARGAVSEWRVDSYKIAYYSKYCDGFMEYTTNGDHGIEYFSSIKKNVLLLLNFLNLTIMFFLSPKEGLAGISAFF